MNTTELFLVAMLMVFSIPYLLWRLGRTDYWAPLVVVQIVTGVLLGPGLLGAAFPAYHQAVFTPAVISALNGVAWWAVSLFVFLAGIELDLGQAWKHRRESVVTSGLALFTPMLLGCAAAAVLLVVPGFVGPRAQTWQFVLGIGMACAVTALPILILLMEKMGIFRQALGQRILRYASLDDIAIWGAKPTAGTWRWCGSSSWPWAPTGAACTTWWAPSWPAWRWTCAGSTATSSTRCATTCCWC